VIWSRYLSILGLVIGAVVFAVSEADASGLDGGANPPIVVNGQRVVELRNTTGALSVYTQIPVGSAFRSHGGVGSPCTFTATIAGVTSDGQAYLPGDVVQSTRWIFEEGTWVAWRPTPPDPANPGGAGPLATAVRWFHVYCDVADSYHFLIYRSVPALDPIFDPNTRLTDLYSRLQLTKPTVFRNPVVDQWGGLVVRYPAWLGIDPVAWATQVTEPAVEWRGWVMDLVATPSELSFDVDFVPDPDKPSPAFHGIVACVAAGDVPVVGEGVLPAVPDLAEQTEPGINGRCTWTPPGPGTVTIQARVTFRVVLRASGFTAARPDYTWTSDPATYATGELTSVNLDPTGT